MKDNSWSDKRKDFMVSIRNEHINSLFEARRTRIMNSANNRLGGSEIKEEPLTDNEKIMEFARCEQVLKKGELKACLEALTSTRSLLSAQNKKTIPVAEFVESKIFLQIKAILEQTIQALANNKTQAADTVVLTEIMNESLWIICNACTADKKELTILSQQGVLELLKNAMIFCLSCTHVHLKDHLIASTNVVLWALCNFIGKDLAMRDDLLYRGVGTVVAQLFTCTTLDKDIITRLVWFCSNILRGPPYPNLEIANPYAAEACRLFPLIDDNEEFDEECCWAMKHYLESQVEQEQRIKNIVQAGVVPKLRKLITTGNRSLELMRAVLRIFGHLSFGSTELIDTFISEDILRSLVILSTNEHWQISADALWALSNYIVGSDRHRKMIPTGKLFVSLCSALIGAHSIQKINALGVIFNYLVRTETDEIEQMLRNNNELFNVLLLNLSDYEAHILNKEVLKVIDRLLIVGEDLKSKNGGTNPVSYEFSKLAPVQHLEGLCNESKDREVHAMAESILLKYFDVDFGN